MLHIEQRNFFGVIDIHLLGLLSLAAASMMQSSQHQHMGRGMEHYITKR